MSALIESWAPRGLIASAYLTANSAQNITSATLTTIVGNVSTNNATGVAAANLQVSPILVNGRVYMVQLCVNAFSSVANDTVVVGASASTGTLRMFVPRYVLPTTSGMGFTITGYYWPTATGVVTFAAQEARIAGTGNINAGASSSISVFDGAPATP